VGTCTIVKTDIRHFFFSVGDPNRLCSDPDFAPHVQSDSDTEPNRIPKRSDTDPA